MTRCGIAAFIGRPNVGKSSLLNRIVGLPLAITSRKPQSTRNRVVGLVSDEFTQIIIADTPGLLEPRYHLQRSLVVATAQAIDDADVIVHVSAPDQPEPIESLLAELEIGVPSHKPLLRVLNKSDLLEQSLDGPLIPVSATSGDGVDALVRRIQDVLPEGPFLYGADDLSTQHLRFFASELIREAAFELLDEELPYSTHVEIDEFLEDKIPTVIRATIFVERPSQKGIVIGDRGSMIRGIGTLARQKIEVLLAQKVFLELWVKVSPNWRRDLAALRRFGFPIPPAPDRSR